MKSDKLLQVTSLESASAGVGDCKFKHEKKSGGVEFERSELTRTKSITHPNLYNKVD